MLPANSAPLLDEDLPMLLTVMLVYHLAYLALVTAFIFFWKKIPDTVAPTTTKPPTSISVVVAVRNEAENILSLLGDLEAQSFRHFEAVIVNDHSEDNTAELVHNFNPKARFPLKVCSLAAYSDNLRGKKQALSLGIEAATGELIVTTDGDCRVGKDWLQSIHAAYQQHRPMLISGPVRLENPENNMLGNFQVLEFMSLIASGAASLRAGYPNMCNGANLAYRKKAFYKVGGFAENLSVPSGDDEFLMHKIHRKFPDKVVFLKDRSALVRTKTQPSLHQFLGQRKRWGSKWTHYQSASPKLVALFIFSYHAVLILATILLVSGNLPLFFWVGLFSTKTLAEWCFLAPILKHYQMKRWQKWIIPTAFFYSFYVVFVGLIANFGRYEWKGRKV